MPQRAAILILLSLLVPACSLGQAVSLLVGTPTPAPPVAPTARPTGTALPSKPTSTPTPTLTPLEPAGSTTPRPTFTPTRTPRPTQTLTPTPASSTQWFDAGMFARHNGDYPGAIGAFKTVLNSKPPADMAQEAQFRIAEVYRLSGDEESTLTALNAYLQANPAGAHVSEANYFLADIYRSRNDIPHTLAYLQAFRARTQALGAETDATIADLVASTGDSAGAIKLYDSALQDGTISSRQRINILMKVAAIHIGRGEAALGAARYDAALAVATDDYTRATLNLYAGQAYAVAGKMDLAIARWNSAITQTPDQPGAVQALTELTNRKIAVDDFQRGILYYHATNYDAAIATFKGYIQGGGPRAGEAHYYLGLINAEKGAYSEAISEYDAIISSFPKDSRVSDAFMEKAAAEETLGNLDEAVGEYKRFVELYPEDARADEALLQAGLVLEGAAHYREAAAVFDQLQATYPNGEKQRAAEALFRAGLDYYRLNEFDAASARWQQLVQRYPASYYYTGALYWLGKVATAQGQTDAGQAFWKQGAALTTGVFDSVRSSYYAYRSRSALKAPPASDEGRLYDVSRYAMDMTAARPELEEWLAAWTKSPAGSLGEPDATLQSDIHFRRGNELLGLDRIADARGEFATLIDTREDDPAALYALARYFQAKEMYLVSISAADRLASLAAKAGAPAAPRGLMLLRYPTYYADLVVAESKANGIDPLLYFAILRLESHFDPSVVGPFKERGLAQINPEVAPEIAKALKIQDYSLSQLSLPYMSVRFGNWLFAQDAKKLDDPIYAFAAYNAGLAAALRWQQPDVDLALEEFDIENARFYVQIVYPYWEEYRELYK